MEGRTLEVLTYSSTGVTLKSGQRVNVPIVVRKTPVSVLHFEFSTATPTASLSVYFFKEDGAKTLLMPATYPNKQGDVVSGSIPIRGRGRVELAWDNGTSWLGRSNTLSYSVKLEYKDVDSSGRLVVHGTDEIFAAHASPSSYYMMTPRSESKKNRNHRLKKTTHSQQNARNGKHTTRPSGSRNTSTSGGALANSADTTSSSAAQPATTPTTMSSTSMATPATASMDDDNELVENTHAEAEDEAQARLLGPQEKVELIFKHFDANDDDLLSYQEMDQLMRTVSVPPRKLDYVQWVEVCNYWRADHNRGLTLNQLMQIYASSPGSVDEEFMRYLQLVRHGTAAIQYLPCPSGWVEVDREDGSSYYMNYADMSKTIEARPPASSARKKNKKSSLERDQNLPPFEEQCRLVFEYFDTDANGFIDLDEMNAYTSAVEGMSGRLLDVRTWALVTSALNENAELGISLTSFSNMYATRAAHDLDLRRDYAYVTSQLEQTRQLLVTGMCVDTRETQGLPNGQANGQAGGPVGHSCQSAHVHDNKTTADGNTASSDSVTMPFNDTKGNHPGDRRRSGTSRSKSPSSPHLHCIDPWQKCQHIFAHFDLDSDGLLNFDEMRVYTAVTEGGEDGTLLRSTYDTLCKRKGVDPELGFACEDLFKIYQVAADKDMARVFPRNQQDSDDMNLHAKVLRIFEEFDKDQDNYMNLEEMNAFTAVTEGEQEQLTREEWVNTCRRMLIDPDIGLAFNDLATIYTAHLDKDFETVVEEKRKARRKKARDKAQKKIQERLWQEQVHGIP